MRIAIIITTAIIAALGAAYTGITIKQAQLIYESENICIERHIRKGVERHNIHRDNGTCYVK